MTVFLIAATKRPLELMYRACKCCTSSDNAHSTDPQDASKLVKKVLKSGHWSIAEHVTFTFDISGISRACANQLTRYRHCSFSQQSLRTVSVLTHDELESMEKISRFSDETMERVFGTVPHEMCDFLQITLFGYGRLLRRGVTPENARAVLPLQTQTRLMMTCNLAELVHICNQRLCMRAQNEIRKLVHQMRQEVLTQYTDAPTNELLAHFLVAQCKALGFCPESRTCETVLTGRSGEKS